MTASNSSLVSKFNTNNKSRVKFPLVKGQSQSIFAYLTSPLFFRYQEYQNIWKTPTKQNSIGNPNRRITVKNLHVQEGFQFIADSWVFRQEKSQFLFSHQNKNRPNCLKRPYRMPLAAVRLKNQPLRYTRVGLLENRKHLFQRTEFITQTQSGEFLNAGSFTILVIFIFASLDGD